MPKPGAIQTSLTAAALLGAVGVISIAGLRAARADAAQRLYKERLRETAERYESLRSHYNTAVRETAVTELLVRNNRVCVTVRTIEGDLRTIETPYRADDEIYIDFALVAGRLWIRRVFDEHTAPSDAVAVDPALADIEWNDPNAHLGRAVYRTLAEGRWIVSTTGDGALTLTQRPEGEAISLAPPPELGAFDELVDEIDAKIESISAADILGSLLGR